MATIINADTSNGLKLTSDTSGEIQLQSGGTTIATVDSTGLTMASGKLIASTGPAFSAYNAGTQAVSAATITKVVFNSENFDTNSNFDSTTNYRFTPTVAGYYQINVGIYYQGANNGFILLYKNGSVLSRLAGTQSGLAMLSGSALVNMNGTTDYLEMYAYDGGGQTIGSGSSSLMFFDGFLARAA